MAATDRQDPLIGRVFDGRYEVLGRIGRGGMGTVYRARQVKLGREVALKVLNPGLSEDAEAAGRFIREAKVASRLRHPNTIVIHDFGNCADGLFMALELLKGETLKERMKRVGPMDTNDAARIGAAMARSLAEAHAAGIVHRDLKPANVFLHQVHGGTEVVKVLDFGVAKFVQDARSKDTGSMFETGGATILGTIPYMAPEQINNSPLDGRSDLYAVGVILFEALSGRRPFVGDTPIAVLRAHLEQPAPPLPRRVPEPMARLVSELLSKDRERRPVGDQVAKRLERMYGGGGQASIHALRRPEVEAAEANTGGLGAAAEAETRAVFSPAEDHGPQAGTAPIDVEEPAGQAADAETRRAIPRAAASASPAPVVTARDEDAAPGDEPAADWGGFGGVVEEPPTYASGDLSDDEIQSVTSAALARELEVALNPPPKRSKGGLLVLIAGLLLAAAAGVLWTSWEAPVTAAGAGRVQVISAPPGARVVDAASGRELGVTPNVVLLGGTDAPRQVRVEREGFYPEQRAVSFPADGGLVKLDVPLEAWLVVPVGSEPAGARVVEVETGKVLGETPLEWRLPRILPDSATLRFELKGHKARQERIPRRDLEAQRALTIKLQPQRSRRHRKH